MAPILRDLPYSRGDEVALLINNLDATTMFELLIANRRSTGGPGLLDHCIVRL